MFDKFSELATLISIRLRRHHDLYRVIKVRDYLWEYILADSIFEFDPNLMPQWEYGSQKIGKDITLGNGFEISCKSGQILNDNRIKISSSRLSRFSDRDLIKQYLYTTRTEDATCCLSTFKRKKKEIFQGKYELSIFEKPLIDYNTIVWTTFGEDNNLRGTDANNATVECTVKMGWQLWYRVPRELASYNVELSVH